MVPRIGVVDTGVNREHRLFRQRKLDGIGVRWQGQDEYEYVADFHDCHGHGTVIAARIQAFCTKAEVHAVRIAQQTNGGMAVRVQEQALAMGIE